MVLGFQVAFFVRGVEQLVIIMSLAFVIVELRTMTRARAACHCSIIDPRKVTTWTVLPCLKSSVSRKK
jgi:hypothetical protein